jgi:hypothetical protein
MSVYKIYFPYVGSKHKEVNIESKNLAYAEIGEGRGCHVVNLDNLEIIQAKCSHIAHLIREIEELNQSK